MVVKDRHEAVVTSLLAVMPLRPEVLIAILTMGSPYQFLKNFQENPMRNYSLRLVLSRIVYFYREIEIEHE